MLRIRDVYPGPRTLTFTHSESRIQKQQQKRGVKKLVVKPFFVATNFTKLKIILFFKCWRKKIWASFQRIKELFIQKFVIKLQKISGWDPGSGKKPIPDPGSATLNKVFCRKSTVIFKNLTLQFFCFYTVFTLISRHRAAKWTTFKT